MPHSTPFDQFAHATSQGWFTGLSFLLRIALGYLFLNSAWSKLASGTWTAAAYLSDATGPFAPWFQSLAGNPWVDQLNMIGQLMIGVAFVLGLFVRPAAFAGGVLMVLYFLAHFTQNTAHGFVEEHVVYFLIFAMFLAGGFGHVWGLDGVIARQPALQKKKWVSWLCG